MNPLKNTSNTNYEMEKLFEVFTALMSDIDLTVVLQKILKNSEELMNAEASSVLLFDRNKEHLIPHVVTGNVASQIKEQSIKLGEGIVGHVAKSQEPLLIQDAYQDSRFSPDMDKKTGFKTKSIICVPLIGKKGPVGVGEIINKKNAQMFDDADFELFKKFCQIASLAIENAILHNEMLKQERITRDLEIAEEIQSTFLPQNIPRFDNLRMHFHYLPCRNLAGDFIDIKKLDSGKLALIVADVSGKGVPAAFFGTRMANDFSYLIRASEDPGQVFYKLNNIVTQNSRKGMFITAILIIADPKTGEAKMVNAGHLKPISVQYSKEKKKGSISEIETKTGFPLGIVENAQFEVTQYKFQKSETLVFMTDGIPDAVLKDGNRFETPAILETLEENPFFPISKIVDIVENNAITSRRTDDVTMAMVQFVNNTHLTIKSDAKNLEGVRKTIEECTQKYHIDEKTLGRIQLAVCEAITNIIRHTYDGKTEEDIHLEFLGHQNYFHAIITDEGEKQDPKNFKSRDLADIKPGGLGVHYLHQTMDYVYFDPTRKKGNRLHLIKLMEARS